MTDPQTLTRLVDQLRRAYEGDAWHGPSVREALEGVTAEQATRKVLPTAHTIHALTHHIAAWADEVRKRLEGRAPQLPDDGDFPAPDESLTEVQWEALRARLDRVHASLVEAILALDPSRVHDRVGGERDAPLGTGVTYYGMVHGLIQHDAYHAGQIVLLKRAMGT
jgi:uncharacterized damage-inducible protein DinB